MTTQKATKKKTTASRTRKRKATTKKPPKATIQSHLNGVVNQDPLAPSSPVSGKETGVSSEDQALDMLKQKMNGESPQPQQQIPGQTTPPPEQDNPVLINVVSEVVLMVSKRVLNIRGLDLKPLDETQRSNFNGYVSRPIVRHFMPANLSGHPELTAAFATLAGICFTNVYKMPTEEKPKEQKTNGKPDEQNHSDIGTQGPREDVPNEESGEAVTTPLNI